MFRERCLFLTNGVTVGFFFEEKVSLVLSPDGSSLVIATASNTVSAGETNKQCLTRFCPTAVAQLVARLLRFRNIHAVLPYFCDRFLEPFERNQPPLPLQSLLYPASSPSPSPSTSSSTPRSPRYHTSQSIHHDDNGASVQSSPSLLLCPLQRRLCVPVTMELLADGAIESTDTMSSNSYRRPSMGVAAVVPAVRVIPVNLVSPPHSQHVQLSSAQTQSPTSREIFAQVLFDLEPELSQLLAASESLSRSSTEDVDDSSMRYQRQYPSSVAYAVRAEYVNGCTYVLSEALNGGFDGSNNYDGNDDDTTVRVEAWWPIISSSPSGM